MQILPAPSHAAAVHPKPTPAGTVSPAAPSASPGAAATKAPLLYPAPPNSASSGLVKLASMPSSESTVALASPSGTHASSTIPTGSYAEALAKSPPFPPPSHDAPRPHHSGPSQDLVNLSVFAVDSAQIVPNATAQQLIPPLAVPPGQRRRTRAASLSPLLVDLDEDEEMGFVDPQRGEVTTTSPRIITSIPSPIAHPGTHSDAETILAAVHHYPLQGLGGRQPQDDRNVTPSRPPRPTSRAANYSSDGAGSERRSNHSNDGSIAEARVMATSVATAALFDDPGVDNTGSTNVFSSSIR